MSGFTGCGASVLPDPAKEPDEDEDPGDRAHALPGAQPGRPERVLTARETPRLLAWGARRDDGATIVLAPGGERFAWEDPALASVLAEDLGRAVALRDGPHPDRPQTLHVTVEGTRRAAQDAVERELDLRRFRTNLHVELDAEPWAEEGWTGRVLRVGDVELDVLSPCQRCVVPTRDPDSREKLPQLLRWLHREHAASFGLIVRARSPATVRTGDAVAL